ncbi:MAG: hypothetical protein F6K19_38115 [Cyanothece sp. SIO1E1]|nr:hypothetical protein [Cyanothece sp. SIO1E1]
MHTQSNRKTMLALMQIGLMPLAIVILTAILLRLGFSPQSTFYFHTTVKSTSELASMPVSQ